MVDLFNPLHPTEEKGKGPETRSFQDASRHSQTSVSEVVPPAVPQQLSATVSLSNTTTNKPPKIPNHSGTIKPGESSETAPQHTRTMTQEDDDYAGEDVDVSLIVSSVPQSPDCIRGSASMGPTIKIDPQPSVSLGLTSKSFQQKHHSHSKSASVAALARRRPNVPTMSSLPKLGDLVLNSLETSQIVGTPFSTDSMGFFECPFPENADFSSRSLSTTSSVHISPTLTTTKWGSTYLSASTSPTMIPGDHQASMGEYPLPSLSSDTSSTSSSTASSTSSFASAPITHSNLIAPVYTNPPIPPSLIKKRPKWGLGMIGRRRSGFEDDEDDGQDFSDVLVLPRDDIMERGEC